LRKRNKILNIADKHGWDTVQEYLDSPLADDKDDAANLHTAIASKALVNTVENKDTAPSVDNSVPSLALELDFRCAVSVTIS
jgi:hypothetical protein